MFRKFSGILLVTVMLIGCFYINIHASKMTVAPHVYDFEDCSGKLTDNNQWDGTVQDTSGNAHITNEVDPIQGKFLKITPPTWDHTLKHNLKPETFKDGKVSVSFAINVSDSIRQQDIGVIDSNNVYTQIFRFRNNKGSSQVHYFGDWQTGDTTFEGRSADRYLSWGIPTNKWYYLTFVFDNSTARYKMRITQPDGTVIFGDARNKGDLGWLKGTAGATLKALEIKTLKGEASKSVTKIDDIAFANYDDVFATVVSGDTTVPANAGGISYKYGTTIEKGKIPTKETMTVTETLNGIQRNVTNFSVTNTPNTINVNLAGELKAEANYKVEFNDSVRTVFGQKIPAINFSASAADMSLNDYYDFEGIVNGAEAPYSWDSAEGQSTNKTKEHTKINNEELTITVPSGNQYWLKQSFKKKDFSDKLLYSFVVTPNAAREQIYSLIGENGIAGSFLRIKADGGVFYNKTVATGVTWEYFAKIDLAKKNYITIELTQSTKTYKVALVGQDGTVKSVVDVGRIDNRFANGIGGSEIYMPSQGTAENCAYDNISISNYEAEIVPLKTNIVNGMSNVNVSTKSIDMKYGTAFLKGGSPNSGNTTVIETKYGISNSIKCDVVTSLNEVKVAFPSNLKDGAKYDIVFDDTVKTVFGQSAKNFSFTTAGEIDIENIVFKNAQGVIESDLNNLPPNLKTIDITYKTAKNQNELDAVKIEGVSTTSRYNGETKTQTLTIESLAPKTEYQLKIGTEIINIKTSAVSFSIRLSVKKAGVEVEQLKGLTKGDTINIEYIVETNSGIAKNATLITGIYNNENDSLMTVDTKSDVISAETGKATFAFDMVLPDFMENTEKYNIKFMIFEDMTNIMPMFDVRCIPSVKPVVNQVFYPGYLKKAVTFSYDDGPKEDKKLIELMDKNGVKGTFNLNSDKYFTYDTTAVLPSDRYDKNKVELGDNVSLQDEVKTRYQGHEVANHVKWHPHMYTDQALPAGFPNLTDAECIRYINEGKADLEKIFNKPITGMAWPYHAPNRPVVMESLKQQAVKYARSIESTSTFDMPSDWLYWKPTAHHTAAYGLWDSFETLTDDGKLKLFSVWGHAYEFSADSSANPPRVDTWNQIDEFLTKVGNNVSVWKATNIDVCNYVKALDSVKIVGDTIYNSSNMDLYMEVSGKRIVLKANGSYKVI